LIDRLGLDYFTFYDIYKSNDGDKFGKLRDAFNLAVAWKFEESMKLLYKINKDTIISEFNLQMYSVTEILAKKKGKLIVDTDTYSKLEKAIDYPNILDKNIINIIELNALFIINTKLISRADDTILRYFSKLVKSDLQNMGFNKSMTAGIYASLAKGYYNLEDYIQCKNACIEGIKESTIAERTSGLANFYGYLALSENKLGNHDSAIDNALKLYMVLQIEQKEEKSKLFIRIIEKNLNIKLNNLITIKKNDGN
jgi:hypothetical protein